MLQFRRALLGLVLAVAPACCPDARPPARGRGNGETDGFEALATAIARLLEKDGSTGGGGSAVANERAADRERRRGDRGDAPAATAGAGAGGGQIPRPQLSRTILDKLVEKATLAITPENADEQLELLRKELDDLEAGVAPVAETPAEGSEESAGAEGEAPTEEPAPDEGGGGE